MVSVLYPQTNQLKQPRKTVTWTSHLKETTQIQTGKIQLTDGQLQEHLCVVNHLLMEDMHCRLRRFITSLHHCNLHRNTPIPQDDHMLVRKRQPLPWKTSTHSKNTKTLIPCLILRHMSTRNIQHNRKLIIDIIHLNRPMPVTPITAHIWLPRERLLTFWTVEGYLLVSCFNMSIQIFFSPKVLWHWSQVKHRCCVPLVCNSFLKLIIIIIIIIKIIIIIIIIIMIIIKIIMIIIKIIKKLTKEVDLASCPEISTCPANHRRHRQSMREDWCELSP